MLSFPIWPWNAQFGFWVIFIILIRGNWGSHETYKVNTPYKHNAIVTLPWNEHPESVVQSKWKSKCLPFIENILDPFQSCICKITFFWKADVLAMQVKIPQNTSAMQMPSLLRVGCGPGRGLCQRGALKSGFTFQTQPPTVYWSLTAQEKQGTASTLLFPYLIFFPWRRSWLLWTREGWWRFYLLPGMRNFSRWMMHKSITRVTGDETRATCLLYKNYIKMEEEEESHRQIHRLAFLTSISFFSQSQP